MKLGNLCKDIVTGFEGILITRMTFITGCDRVELRPLDVEKEVKSFDIKLIKVIGDGIADEIKELNQFDDLDKALYSFGDEVKDKITEFTGKITGKFIGITGDICYGISPKHSPTNRENDAMWFDEGRLEIIKEKVVEIKTDKERVGGVVPTYKYR